MSEWKTDKESKKEKDLYEKQIFKEAMKEMEYLDDFEESISDNPEKFIKKLAKAFEICSKIKEVTKREEK